MKHCNLPREHTLTLAPEQLLLHEIGVGGGSPIPSKTCGEKSCPTFLIRVTVRTMHSLHPSRQWVCLALCFSGFACFALPVHVTAQGVIDHFTDRVSQIFSPPDGNPQNGNPQLETASEDLNQWLRAASPSDRVEVDVVVPVEPAFDAINGFSRSIFVEVSNGRVKHSRIDGRDVSLDEIDASNAAMDERLEQDKATRRVRSKEAWNRLLETIRDDALAAALREASGQGAINIARIRVSARQLNEFAGPANAHVQRVERSRRMEELSVDEDMNAIGLGLASGGSTAGSGIVYTGAGVEAWQAEPGLPDFNHPWLSPNNVVYRGSTSEAKIGGHATQMAAIFTHSAPGSRFNWVEALYSTLLPPADFFSGRSAIQIANLSVGASGEGDVPYDLLPRTIDEWILSERDLVIQSSGNKGPSETNFKIQGALARNELTVGAASAQQQPYGMWAGSAYGQPPWSGPKPEMVAPGTNLSTQSATVEVHRNGTSGAAALTSGLAVNVLEAYPELQNSPAALKVLLMAASSHVSSSSASPPHVMAAKQGAGLPHFGLLKNLNAIGVVAEEPSNHPNPNDIIPPLGLTLSAGTWRIGFAWLNSGEHALNNGGQASSQWQLKVTPPTGAPVVMNEPNQGFQIMEITVPTTGPYLIETTRTNLWYDMPISLGLVLVKK